MTVRDLIFADGPAQYLGVGSYLLFLASAVFALRRNYLWVLRGALWAWVALSLTTVSRAVGCTANSLPTWLIVIAMHQQLVYGVFIGSCCSIVVLCVAAFRQGDRRIRLALLGSATMLALVAAVVWCIDAFAVATELTWTLDL